MPHSQHFKDVEEKPGGYYKAECDNCGSTQYCNGFSPIADTGDYSEGHCPICDATID